jgi:hypothetical protein
MTGPDVRAASGRWYSILRICPVARRETSSLRPGWRKVGR